MNLIAKAWDFAERKHRGQMYGERPYIYHLRAVADELYSQGIYVERVLVAAILHDVLEDTDTTYTELTRIFGFDVADIVEKVSNKPGKNRAERHAATYPAIRENPWAKMVKLADRIANIREGGKLGMYKKEWPSFKEALYLPKDDTVYVLNKMWKTLESLLED